MLAVTVLVLVKAVQMLGGGYVGVGGSVQVLAKPAQVLAETP